MEPPLKRLRLLREDYAVDEENPDYIAAKQEQQQKFKNKWEEIFHKFSNMHASMSDEIHLAEERIVKDRGHLRRLDRQARRSEQGMLMKTLGLLTRGEGDDEDGDAAELDKYEDSEDELAPVQVVKKCRGRPKGSSKHTAQKKQRNAVARPATATPTASIPNLLPQTAATPNPTIQLLQFLPPPETPEGQQARSVFQQILNQQGNTQDMAGMLPQTPGVDLVAPATDPKWYFPPLSAVTAPQAAAQSSPIPVSTRSPITAFQRPIRKLAQAKKPLSPLSQSVNQKQAINGQSVRESRRIHSETPDPLLNLEEETTLSMIKTEDVDEDDIQGQASHADNIVSHSTLLEDERGETNHHLLTPTSLDREIIEKPADNEENVDDGLDHQELNFDDEDRELLSLDGENSSDEMLLEDELPMVTSSPPPEDVLPSIEEQHVVEEEVDEVELVKHVGTDEPSPPPDIRPIEVEEVVELALSSPIKSRKRKRSIGKVEISQQPEDGNGLDNQEVADVITFTCETCQRSFQSAARLDRHRAFPPKAHVEALRQLGSHVDEPEQTLIKAPLTPIIKREVISPSRTSFLFRTPHTPYAAEKPASGAKSTSKLSRKAFLKQVKQSWRKQGVSTSKVFAKPRGFFDTPVKGPSMVDVDSEDELAL